MLLGLVSSRLVQVMHGMLEMYNDLPNANNLLDDKAITSGWQAYKEVNRAFRDKVRHES